MFFTKQVQRQDAQDRASDDIDVPDLYTVLQLSNNDQSQFHLEISDILIREEYLKALYDICDFSVKRKFPVSFRDGNFRNPFLDDIQSKPKPCAVTLLGHPGIGKSIWLIVVLVLRILAGRPTIYQSKANIFYIFNADGLHRVNPGSFEFECAIAQFNKVLSSQYWCLVDCGRELKDVPSFISETRAFILQTASPRHEHLDWVKKYNKLAVSYYMKNWSLGELIIGRTFQSTDFEAQCSEKSLEYFYSRYAPSTRMAYAYANDIDAYDTIIQHEIENLTFESLGKMLSNAQALQDETVSHHILLINPAESTRTDFSITISSRYIHKKLCDQLDIHTLEQAARLYQIFVRNKYSKVSAGYILDDINNSFCQGGQWKVTQMTKNKPGDQNTHFKSPGLVPTGTKFMHINYQGNVLTLGDHPLTESEPTTSLTCHLFNPNQDSILNDGYYQPAPGQATLDSFIYDKATKVATLLQMTASTKHDFKCSGMEWLKRQHVENIRVVVIKPSDTLDFVVPNNVVSWINEGVFELVVDSLPG